MKLNEYEKLAVRTAKVLPFTESLVHAQLGISGEAGEFADAIKKSLIYDQELHHENCVEELGDIMWYVALAANTLGVPLSDIAQHNIEKLKRRYPEKYTDQLAATRLDKVEEFNEDEFISNT